MKNFAHKINQYVAELNDKFKTGTATEHTYRPALQTLFESITEGLEITNEPKRIECGAPDFIVTRAGLPVGYIEAKDIPVGIHSKENQAQFNRYKQSLSSLIITDYINFELFLDGELTASVSIGRIEDSNIVAEKSNYPAFLELVNTFTGYEGANIYQTEQLARIMAAKARLLAQTIETALLNPERGDDELMDQLQAFKEVLIHDLSEKSFADMYAQTLAYGMFAARLNDRAEGAFTRKKAAELVPRSNPFLQRFFRLIADIDLDSRIAWMVDALADVFNNVAIDAIQKEFDQAKRDPYIHFYETFLSEYDPALRKARGVWYTPEAAVKFIVKAVDDILIKDFQLPDGLADRSKVTMPLKGKDGHIAETEVHKVQILDPALGTGTFLSEAINIMYAKYLSKKGMWNSYCEEHLIPRLNGFEILMAPYAMAHFKLSEKLKSTGFSWSTDSRLHVFLTNTLEIPPEKPPELFMVKWLSREAEEANKIKRDAPIMVVFGNPPYSGESQNRTDDSFLQDYKKEPEANRLPGGSDKLQERNPKWLNDDYVKFIRYGQNLVHKNATGILAYINNHSFLDNPTFRGMRWNLLTEFDAIYILNLHGNAKKLETAPEGGKDENVFDIQQGVSINIFVKTGKKPPDYNAEVFYGDLYGTRESKYAFLAENTLKSVKWQRLETKTPYYFFVPKNFTGNTEYEKGFGVQEMFPVSGIGITTAHDEFVISESHNELLQKFENFKKTAGERTLLYSKFKVVEKKGWDILQGWKNIQKETNLNTFIQPIQYRPFDNRYIFFEHTLVWRTVKKVMAHLFHEDNLALITCRQMATDTWSHIGVTKHIVDNCFVSNKTKERGYAFPLYLYPDSDELDSAAQRRPNLNMDIVREFEKLTGLRFTPEKPSAVHPTNKAGPDSPAGSGAFSPIDLLDYIYAVLYSPSYRQKYREFLKTDFPRAPYPRSAGHFRGLAALGASLRQIHLLENMSVPDELAAYPVDGTHQVDRSEYKDGAVWINKTQYFQNVPREAWEFYIGGYQPAQKWLKDRRGHVLGVDQIEHYQKIITALQITVDVQARIEEALW